MIALTVQAGIMQIICDFIKMNEIQIRSSEGLCVCALQAVMAIFKLEKEF